MRGKKTWVPFLSCCLFGAWWFFFIIYIFFLMVFRPSPGLFYITFLKVWGGALIRGVGLTPAWWELICLSPSVVSIYNTWRFASLFFFLNYFLTWSPQASILQPWPFYLIRLLTGKISGIVFFNWSVHTDTQHVYCGSKEGQTSFCSAVSEKNRKPKQSLLWRRHNWIGFALN